MCRIQNELFYMKLWEICFHGEKEMQERKHIMPGSLFQKRKNRKIAKRIRTHIHVEMIAEEIAFPMGILSPVAVWLGKMGFVVTEREPWFGSKDRITFLHDEIGQRQVKIPKLNDRIPRVFGKNKGIRIKFQEFRYESILIGGMSVGITR